MGDHRFSFKATFEMHGVKKEINLGWCNWGGGPNDIDRRITEWLETARDAAYRKFNDEEAAAEEERTRGDREKAERSEYERLKTKFEPPAE